MNADTKAGKHAPHVVDARVLVAVLLALIALTVLTVAVTYVDLGALNLWIALGIAVVKGGLVALYFMHLRYDKPFNGLVLVIALVFLMLFIGMVMLDSGQYAADIIDGPAPGLRR